MPIPSLYLPGHSSALIESQESGLVTQSLRLTSPTSVFMARAAPPAEELLWLRQETSHLVLPSLAHVGVQLTYAVALKCLRRLLNEDSKVSFDRWFIVAKEELRWNDSCIKLLWDNVHVSSYKMNEVWSSHTDTLDFEFLAILLVMHVVDDPPSSPKVSSDSSWPEDLSEASSPVSPKAFPSSRATNAYLPKSPRSPKSSNEMKYNTSYNRLLKRNEIVGDIDSLDKKTSLGSGRLAKSGLYSLNSLRTRMPAILRALSMENSTEDEVLSSDTSHDFIGLDLMISRRAVNALGVIICGGYSREEQVVPLSSLVPLWRSKKTIVSDISDEREFIHCAVFLNWFNSHICVNDVIYPTLSFQSYQARSSALLNDNPPEIHSNTLENSPVASLPVAPPIRVLESLSTLSSSRPTVLHDFHSSTYIHAVTSGPIPRKMSSVSLETRSKPDSSSAMSVSDQGAESTTPNTSDAEGTQMSEGADGNVFSDSDNDNYTINAVAEKDSSGLSDIETEKGSSMGDREKHMIDVAVSGGQSDLPHLVIKGCTRSALYFLSPFSSASIVDCHDCEIIVGPVSGIVVFSGCIKTKLSIVCRKLIVKSSFDCIFYLGTLSATLINGDSHSLRFGKLLMHFSS